MMHFFEVAGEHSIAQVMPGITPQRHMTRRGDVEGRGKWKGNRGKFKPFLPLINMGNVRSLTNKIGNRNAVLSYYFTET